MIALQFVNSEYGLTPCQAVLFILGLFSPIYFVVYFLQFPVTHNAAVLFIVEFVGLCNHRIV